MKASSLKGFSFGLTSGVITTLGIIVGLYSSTHSKFAVLGGIFSIAIADAFSDALGMHISVESENKHSTKQIWQATISTFLTKFVFALTFVAPILIFRSFWAIVISVIWGISILAVYSYFLAQKEKISPIKVIGEHLFIAVLVILITQLVGQLIRLIFI